MSKGTKLRTFRISEDLWTVAKQRAADEGRALTDVVRKALVEYAEAGGQDTTA